jgi:hypothetical protein
MYNFIQKKIQSFFFSAIFLAYLFLSLCIHKWENFTNNFMDHPMFIDLLETIPVPLTKKIINGINDRIWLVYT